MKIACLVAFFGAMAAAECNAPLRSPIEYVKVPGHPFGVVPSSDGCWLFVSMPSEGLAIIHSENGRAQVARKVKTKGHPTGIVLTHDGKMLIVAAGSLVLFLDVERLKSGKNDPEIATISDGEKAGSVYVNVTEDDKILFISDEAGGTITVVDLEHDRKIIGTIPVGRAPIALTFSKDEKCLYTTSEIAAPDWNWPKTCQPEVAAKAQTARPEGAVVIVDVQRARTDPAQSIISRVPAGCVPVRLALSPDSKQAYITVRNDNAVLAFDTGKLIADPAHARLHSAPVGTAPVPVIALPSGNFVISGNSNRFDPDQSKQQMLDLIDTSEFVVKSHIPAGAYPREMRLSPDGNTLFLTNFSSDSVEIIDLKRAIP